MRGIALFTGSWMAPGRFEQHTQSHLDCMLRQPVMIQLHGRGDSIGFRLPGILSARSVGRWREDRQGGGSSRRSGRSWKKSKERIAGRQRNSAEKQSNLAMVEFDCWQAMPEKTLVNMNSAQENEGG